MTICKTIYVTPLTDIRVPYLESIQTNLFKALKVTTLSCIFISEKNKPQTSQGNLQRTVHETPERCSFHLLHQINFMFGKEQSVQFLCGLISNL